MYDFIGDVHGHSEKLEELLGKLGYVNSNNTFAHPERKAFFVGDYIDRGPQIKRTLEIVKGMVDSGNAIALMGNHEYNALCFHYHHKKGGHLRKHEIKNIVQHYETLKQFQNRQEEYEGYIEWFKTLPLYYETTSFRAVHACWDTNHIEYLKTVLPNDRLNDDLLYESTKKGSLLYNALDTVLKGKEISLPHGLGFTDKDGTTRSQIRIKWWEDPLLSTYNTISVEPIENLPLLPVQLDEQYHKEYYSEELKPVFFGHYWLKGNPALYRNNICCLDYSVAKNGYLAAYRFDGEEKLQEINMVYV